MSEGHRGPFSVESPLGKTVGGALSDLFEELDMAAHKSETHFARSMRKAAAKSSVEATFLKTEKQRKREPEWQAAYNAQTSLKSILAMAPQSWLLWLLPSPLHPLYLLPAGGGDLAVSQLLQGSSCHRRINSTCGQRRSGSLSIHKGEELPSDAVGGRHHTLRGLPRADPSRCCPLYYPQKPNPSFLSNLSEFLTQLCSISLSILLLGDFNIYIDSTDCKLATPPRLLALFPKPSDSLCHNHPKKAWP
ncbi:unnamed protein product [Pleuronectes platessa]|uniref:Uncharacterized protein n=1 Tax=Pleuronectes platessa TaxID=8262 RepID=A0A9N7ULD7_PLEPL|nr:unnamed protein product [Pleuronectes platessa]